MTWGSHVPVLLHDASFDWRIDRLLDVALRAVGGWASARSPECNVYETDDHFYMQLAIPGVDVSHVEARVEDQVLLVKGERRAGIIGDSTRYAQEAKDGSFACSFRLPSHVDHARSTATSTQGILSIRFPKRAEAKPCRIMIETQGRASLQLRWWKRWKKTFLAWFERLSWPRRRWLR